MQPHERRGFHDASIGEAVAAHLRAVFVRIGLQRQRALELLAAALDRHFNGAVFIQIDHAEHRGNVAFEIDALAVDGPDHVADHDAVFALLGKCRVKLDDLRRIEALGASVQADHNKEAGEEIHRRACDEDQQLLPKALLLQRARVVAFLVLALHRTEAADGQKA